MRVCMKAVDVASGCHPVWNLHVLPRGLPTVVLPLSWACELPSADSRCASGWVQVEARVRRSSRAASATVGETGVVEPSHTEDDAPRTPGDGAPAIPSDDAPVVSSTDALAIPGDDGPAILIDHGLVIPRDGTPAIPGHDVSAIPGTNTPAIPANVDPPTPDASAPITYTSYT